MEKAMDLNQYLNHEFQCKCGRTHKTDLKVVDVDQNATSRLPEHISSLGFKKPFLVADKNTWKAAGKSVAEVLTSAGMIFSSHIFHEKNLIPDEKALGSLIMAVPDDTDVILAIGSGTINDLCKFSSFKLGLPYMVFATAPSMDGFVSIGAALVTDFVKTTYSAHVPLAVIGDTEILSQAPMEMIVAGLGDILGKYTCLLDWKMAQIINGEYYCDTIAGMVKEAVEIVVEESTKVKDRNPAAVKAITEALILSGIAMSFTENSRPASGSEHHLSHYWEMKFQAEGKPPVLHGIKVGIGMIAVTQMYEMFTEEKIDFASARNASFDASAWEEKVRNCFGQAAEGILALEERSGKNNLEKRNQRLTILENKWPLIRDTIKENLPSSQKMIQLLQSLGAPVRPSQVGISDEMTRDAIILAKEIRDRFTLLQMLWDTGLLESYAEEITASFRE